MNGRVILVDDDQTMCEMLEEDLGRRGFEVRWFADGEQALKEIAGNNVDVVLTDLNLPGVNGLELCRRMKESRSDIPVIVFTAFGSMESAIGAMRAGAFDFVTKPIDLGLLSIALDRAIRHGQLQQKVAVLSKALQESGRFDDIVGESDVMRRLFDILARVAGSPASILITGESGTGKELVARAIHKRSDRASRPFLAINCAALPESLLESELFGHKRGAFTDAKSDHDGLFIRASGGTLFLDEVGELPLALQPKLLRALQERRVRPVGGGAEVPVDVRIVAATNIDLEKAIESRRFREDLYYRLNVIHIPVPPLRERGTDVLLLAKHFLHDIAVRSNKDVHGIADPAAARLLTYPWPGNARELRNAIERAVALTTFDMITLDDLPDKVRRHRPELPFTSASDSTKLLSLRDVEQQYIEHVLRLCDGNRTRASQILGLDRKTLYRKLTSGEEAEANQSQTGISSPKK